MIGNSCSAVIDGTAANAGNGYARFEYYDPGASSNLGGLLETTKTGNLHVYDVTGDGCQNLVHDGDQVSFVVGFDLVNSGQVSPVITSP
jgi:hypothetical protein